MDNATPAFSSPAIPLDATDGERPAALVPVGAGLVACFSALGGGWLLASVNGTLEPILLIAVYLTAGTLLTALLDRRNHCATRAFALSFGLCVLAAGLCQYYSNMTFEEPHTFVDAVRFFGFMEETPPYPDLAKLGEWVQASLALYVWQRLYWVYGQFSLPHQVWSGLLFNCFLVALSSALAVLAARQVFGDDRRRLNRVGTLCALCGLFWLFGAIFIRDCFPLFLNSLTLYALLRTLRRPNLANLALAAFILGTSAYAMGYLRPKAVVLFGLFAAIAFFCWYWGDKLTPTRFMATLAIPLIFVAGAAYIQRYVMTSMEFASGAREDYISIAEAASSQESLGLALVNRQPMPIRLVLGSGRMLIDPIPLWAYIRPEVGEYHLLKTYNGAFSILVTPFVLAGFVLVLMRTFKAGKGLDSLFFVAVYCLVTLLGVVATSLETRHLGQFLPAFFLLAAVPDRRKVLDRQLLRYAFFCWFALVCLAYFAWASMRFL